MFDNKWTRSTGKFKKNIFTCQLDLVKEVSEGVSRWNIPRMCTICFRFRIIFIWFYYIWCHLLIYFKGFRRHQDSKLKNQNILNMSWKSKLSKATPTTQLSLYMECTTRPLCCDTIVTSKPVLSNTKNVLLNLKKNAAKSIGNSKPHVVKIVL